MMKYFVHSLYHFSCVSGPHYDYIDEKGKISVWKLGSHTAINIMPNLLDGTTVKPYPTFILPISKTDKQLVFTRLYQLEMLPAFHRQQHWNMPLKMNKWIGYLGNTSFCWEMSFHNAITDELIGSGVFHAVCVDKETRRPTSIKTLKPHIHKDVGAEQLTRKKAPSGFVQPDMPRDCFVKATLVTSSCIDTNQHQNMPLYIRDCWNTACSAACEKSLPHFDEELTNFDAKKVTVLCLGEALLGDIMHIACWEHQDDPQIICCTIMKESMIIFQCQMEFYPQDQTAHQPHQPLSKL
ncbi:uncharacterized protein [Amphiura filiformis]|uniref:uncharacterized protein n=1 Tax=Amphiura filiformis TaxID=82378 RepID=UPI003B211226